MARLHDGRSVMPGPAPTVSDHAERDVRRFLHHEARLIDEGRFEDWLALFDEDGLYWIPSRRGQTDARAVPSIVYDDRRLLTVRIRRLLHPRAYAAQPMPRTLHIVGNVEVVEHDASRDEFRVASNLLMVEYQEPRQRIFAGNCEHMLRRRAGTFRIALKRVDLIDCDGLHGIMTVPL